jgi:hypothetical protein
MIELTKNQFWENRTWDTKISLFDLPKPPGPEMVSLFDQDGYRLTRLEQYYADSNGQPYALHGHERALRKLWMTHDEVTTGPHINHAFLFERKGYSDEALEQLKEFSKENNLVYKLINYKGKWGVDFNIDYVDESGIVFELYHYEYDSFSLDEISQIKEQVEKLALNTDWADAAKKLIERKAEWIDLDIFQQSDWKSNFFGVKSDSKSQRAVDKHKIIAWE